MGETHSGGHPFTYRFSTYHPTSWGRSLYLTGNQFDLGHWNLDKAIKMKCQDGKNWYVQQQFYSAPRYRPRDIEFKYVQASDESVHKETQWETGSNRKIWQFQVCPDWSSDLHLMTYNVRYDNPEDGSNRWDNRKQALCQMILTNMPSVVGVQEAKPHQRAYMQDIMRGYYGYVGTPRDLNNDEEVGIFYLTQRFDLQQSGFIWLNENKEPGKPGFGCQLPRNLSYVILKDIKNGCRFLVINTHLDISQKAQKLSIPIIIQTVADLQSKYSINDTFILGDFNCFDKSETFKPLYEYGFKSTRYSCKTEDASSITFNGFYKFVADCMIKVAANVAGYSAVIDHIFYNSKGYEAKEFKVLKNHDKLLSDHYAVVASFGRSV